MPKYLSFGANEKKLVIFDNMTNQVFTNILWHWKSDPRLPTSQTVSYALFCMVKSAFLLNRIVSAHIHGLVSWQIHCWLSMLNKVRTNMLHDPQSRRADKSVKFQEQKVLCKPCKTGRASSSNSFCPFICLSGNQNSNTFNLASLSTSGPVGHLTSLKDIM